MQRREFIKQVGAAAPLLATGGILEIGSQASRYPFFEEFLANCSDARRIFLSSIIRSRNLPLFKKWQESGISLDMEPWDHAIYEAASVGWLDGVQMLLDSGVDVNRADKWFGWTPLISAAEGNHPIVMKHLIDRGADVNAPDIEGHTSLHAVAWQKFGLQSARLLIDHGADLNLKDDGGVTPLSVAIENGNWQMVRLLLNSGASAETAAETLDAIRRFLHEETIVHVYCPGCNASIHHSLEM